MANTAAKDAPAKGDMKNLLSLGVIGLVAVAAGIAVPHFLLPGPAVHEHSAENEVRSAKGHKAAFVSFGEVVVNLAEGRLTRYLRVKLIMVVEESQEKVVKELVDKQKAILKNWLISYLCDKSLEEVTGAAGVNRLRRDIQDNFNSLLFADEAEKIRDILFEEFNIQ